VLVLPLPPPEVEPPAPVVPLVELEPPLVDVDELL
jgi:hypothetical protein